MKTGQWLVLAGSFILLLTALVHGLGYSQVPGALAPSGGNRLSVVAFKALWLMFSTHLALLSAVFVVASRVREGKWVILVCMLIPASDTVLLFHFVGVFIGTILLAIATLCFIVGGILIPRESAA